MRSSPLWNATLSSQSIGKVSPLFDKKANSYPRSHFSNPDIVLNHRFTSNPNRNTRIAWSECIPYGRWLRRISVIWSATSRSAWGISVPPRIICLTRKVECIPYGLWLRRISVIWGAKSRRNWEIFDPPGIISLTRKVFLTAHLRKTPRNPYSSS